MPETYRPIAETETDAEAPLTADLLKALQKNHIAQFEGDGNAPVNAWAWHPFNKLINNDANTGRIWSFPVNGAVAAVTTPDFENGWEYALLIDQVRATGAGVLRVNRFRETSAAYAGVVQVGTANSAAIGAASSVSGWIELPKVRQTLRQHQMFDSISTDQADGQLVQETDTTTLFHTTAQKILRAQLTSSVGNLTGSGSTGAIFLYRRREIGSL